MNFSLTKVTSEGVFPVTCDETKRFEGSDEFVTNRLSHVWEEREHVLRAQPDLISVVIEKES